MARFLSLLVLFLATCLLAVGPAASMSAAESNRIGAAELPEVNPLTPSSAPAAEPPRAEGSPVVEPGPVAPAPVSLETKAAGPGFFDWIISGITRVLNLDRGKSTAVETPPVVQAPPQVVAEKTDALAAEINVAVAPEPAPASELAENPASTAVNIVWPIPSLISVVAAKPEPTPEPAPAAAAALTSVIAVKPAPTPEPAPAAAPALISVIAVKPAPAAAPTATPAPAAVPAPASVIAAKPAPAPAPASVIAVKPTPAPAPASVIAVKPAPAAAPTATPAPAAAPAPASVIGAKPAAKPPFEMPQAESAAVVSSRRSNWLRRNWGSTASMPALVAGAVPSLRTEERRARAPNLPRQMRLDMDQRIERLGPQLEPVSGSDVSSSASLSSAPAVAGIEETVLTLEAAALVQAKAAGGFGAGGMAGKITRRSDEIRLIPDETKQRERFREVSVFFDPPRPPKSSKPAETPTSSATYETK